MSKKNYLNSYSTIAAGKINTLSGKFSFSAEAWNAYHYLLALREFGSDIKKNSERRLYDKLYNKFVNSGKLGLALHVEHELLRKGVVR